MDGKSIAVIVLALAVAFLLLGSDGNTPGPGPGPDVDRAEAVAAECMDRFAELSAEALERSASSPAASSNEHGKRVTEAIDAAYDQAFEPVNALAESTLGGTDPQTRKPRFTPEAAQAFDAATARGYRKALQ